MIGRIQGALLAAAVALFGLGSFAQSAKADVIFDQYVATPVNAFGSDFGISVGIQEWADDFHLDVGASTITDIHWWGLYGFNNTPTSPDNFTVRIFGNSGSVPSGDPIYELVGGDVARVDTGADFSSFDIYSYVLEIEPLVLEADTTYWLSIVNDTIADVDDTWYWLVGSGGKPAHFSNGTWGNGSGHSFSFQLTNDRLAIAIPEPATLALFGAGLVSLGVIARRRKAA